MNSLSYVKWIGYTILYSPYHYLQRELAVLGFEGLFVKLEEYLPKWAIASALWIGLLMLFIQGIQTAFGFFFWLIDPLAERGLLGPAYAETWRLISGGLGILLMVGLVTMVSGWLILRRETWRNLKGAERYVKEASATMNEVRLWLDEVEQVDPNLGQTLRDRIKLKSSPSGNPSGGMPN